MLLLLLLLLKDNTLELYVGGTGNDEDEELDSSEFYINFAFIWNNFFFYADAFLALVLLFFFF